MGSVPQGSPEDGAVEPLASLRERVTDLLQDTLLRARGGDDSGWDDGGWEPPADVFETRDAFVVSVELPGFEQKDVEVRVDGRNLTISGEREAAHEAAEGGTYRRVERVRGTFRRAFRLGADVSAASVRASVRDGVLEVTLPKTGGGSGPGVRVPIE